MHARLLAWGLDLGFSAMRRRHAPPVVRSLHEIVAAKGFEAEPFFEVAAHEIGMLPKLEATAHVNMALIVKFMHNFLFAPAEYAAVGKRQDASNDAFLFDQGPTAGLGKIRFHDYKQAYAGVDLPSVAVFRNQIEAFRSLLSQAGPNPTQAKDIGYMLALGECFCLVAYGQLILENAPHLGADEDLVDRIFDFMVRDMSRHALNVFNKPSSSAEQKQKALAIIQAPVADGERCARVWQNQVLTLKGSYPTGC